MKRWRTDLYMHVCRTRFRRAGPAADLLSPLLVLALLSGCVERGAGERETNYIYQATPPVTDFSFTQRGDLGGSENEEIWARLEVLSGLAEIPAFGLKVNETISILRLTLQSGEDGLRSVEEVCATEINRPDVPSVQTKIPTAFIRSIPLATRAVLVDGATNRFAYQIVTHGAYLRDPEREALPTEVDDPRVFDQDQDQAPGVTIRSEGLLEGEMHLVQRMKTRLVGEREDDQMEGRIEWSSEESILWGSSPILENPVPMVPNEDPAQSYFVAQRIDPSWTCAEILAQREMLFWDPRE